jgi:hypothetical protein
VDAVTHDPGGKVRLKLQPGVRGMAGLSPCGHYRYWLSRFWDDDTLPIEGLRLVVDNSAKSGIQPYALWIGMNPSTAEADIDDPTIRKEMHFTRAMGLSGYIKCNVMDYRATYPMELQALGVKPCSDENHTTIAKMARHAEVIIAAWGALNRPVKNFATSVALMLSGYELLCMGTNKDGSPKHPLYLANTTEPQIWP